MVHGLLTIDYIGAPPEKLTVDGKTMSPREYFTNVVRLNLDDYVDLVSMMERPYFEMTELEGAIGGDTSEPGLDGHAGVALVPTFDIPSAPGDFFFHEDYVKLKMLSAMLHKDAAKEVLSRMKASNNQKEKP